MGCPHMEHLDTANCGCVLDQQHASRSHTRSLGVTYILEHFRMWTHKAQSRLQLSHINLSIYISRLERIREIARSLIASLSLHRVTSVIIRAAIYVYSHFAYMWKLWVKWKVYCARCGGTRAVRFAIIIRHQGWQSAVYWHTITMSLNAAASHRDIGTWYNSCVFLALQNCGCSIRNWYTELMYSMYHHNLIMCYTIHR